MTRWAQTVVARKWWVLSLAVLIVLISGVWGLGVFGKLSQGGFIDPGSDSAKVADIIEDNLGPQTPDIIAIYSPTDGKTLDDIGPAVTAAVDQFKTEVPTASVKSYWGTDAAAKASLLSNDGSMAAVAITLAPDSGVTPATFADLLPKLEVEGAEAQFAGNTVVGVAFNTKLEKDLVVAEAIAIPITLVLLVFIFGGIVAAAVPVFVGVLSVLSALAVLRILTLITDVSSFSINVASLLGLGLAIDYGLFVVGRFREELNSGSDPGAAAQRTVLTAGRTVMFSGLLLICAFSGMLVFPQAVIRSLGFGAIAAVLSAAVLSLTAVPALLAILGHRINALTWRKDAAQRGEERSRKFWGRVVTWVMKASGRSLGDNRGCAARDGLAAARRPAGRALVHRTTGQRPRSRRDGHVGQRLPANRKRRNDDPSGRGREHSHPGRRCSDRRVRRSSRGHRSGDRRREHQSTRRGFRLSTARALHPNHRAPQ